MNESRQPIIPLSLEDVNLARTKEFIFDYVNNNAYIKLVDGTLFNITESEAGLNYIKQYLINNPDILLNVVVKSSNSENRSFQEGIDYIYESIDRLSKKELKYASSSTTGGSAYRAKKVDHTLSIKSESGTTSFNGNQNKTVNIQSIGLLKKTGGYVDGPMIPKKKFLLAEGYSYGKTLPATGVEGQLFILLKEDV